MNNTHAGIIIATTMILTSAHGWSWWYTLPLAYAIIFSVYPTHTDLLKELTELQIKKLRIELKLLEKKEATK